MEQKQIIKKISELKEQKNKVFDNKGWDYVVTDEDRKQVNYLHSEIVRLNGMLTTDYNEVTSEDIQADNVIARLEDYDS